MMTSNNASCVHRDVVPLVIMNKLGQLILSKSLGLTNLKKLLYIFFYLTLAKQSLFSFIGDKTIILNFMDCYSYKIDKDRNVIREKKLPFNKN